MELLADFMEITVDGSLAPSAAIRLWRRNHLRFSMLSGTDFSGIKRL
jgi:hypothetical protein